MNRRLLAMAGALALAALSAGCGGGAGGDGATAAKKPPPLPTLPDGTRTILPGHTVVAYYGAPQDDELGALGIGTPRRAGRALANRAKRYDRHGRPALPAMELIAAIASYAPGDDGMYRTRQSDRVIRRYLRAARRIKAILILDIQPGHAGFFEEATALEKWLRKPDVSLALDPEWHTPDAVPGSVIGNVDVREVNAISFWLDRLTAQRRLPQKLLLVHRFTQDAIVGEQDLKPRKHVAVTVNVDGFGSNEVKVAKYKGFAQHRPGLHNGFKLFFKEDPVTMRPRQVLRLRPRPELVVYE